ncbi:MAG: 23S rRNA (guanosine(2251)-2'-O)-methyltransferase RlmB [Muribaculaceae bacterium]|nr:23S rRNA (guanosine(2251)-2'-O)-methyltransferase RlmB [Muribaculaceae bacterium]
METSDYIFGLHPVIEAIQAGRTIDKIFLKKDLHGDLAIRLSHLAKDYDITVQRVPVERLNKITRKNHQGVIAQTSAIDYHKLSDIVPQLFEEGALPFVLVLDGLTDVRNFGAIARTAECCGVNAIVIPSRGSVSVGADAVKTSAGALLHVPVCRENSLAGAVRFLKESGYQIVCATEKSSENYTLADYTTPVAIVMGAEDIGISPDILKLADTRAAIPMFGHIGSLNVGVAAGVMMYEVVRQRLADNLEII